jgi:hypothetical protein
MNQPPQCRAGLRNVTQLGHRPGLLVIMVCIDQPLHTILLCKFVCSAGVGVRVYARKANREDK